MCEFVSWIEHEEKNYFLTNADLETKEGKKLLKPEVKDDLCGHGALLSFYPELKEKGVQKECIDFFSPKNFPKEIVKAIKEGKLSRIGVCLDVLNDKGKIEYNKIVDSAWAEYNKIADPAWAEYNKIAEETFSKIVSQKKYRNDEWK